MISPTGRRAVALWAVTLASLACTQVARADLPPSTFRPFAADSVWNLPLDDNAPIASNSAGEVSYLQNLVSRYGSWLNYDTCAMPEYWVSYGAPTVAVSLDHPDYEDPAMINAWSAVPIPSDAAAANCSDNNFAVLQPQPDGSVKEWEFWEAKQASDGSWSAEWGGAMTNALTDRGIGSPLEWTDSTATQWSARQSNIDWNVSASSESMIGGVITPSELSTGDIDHALAIAITQAAYDKWMWPAQRSDGASSDPNALPEGAHLRLPASLDVDSLNVPPLIKLLAKAAQKYGIVVRDQTGSSNAFMMEPDSQDGSLIDSLLGGQPLWTALSEFPWSQLEVLNTPVCSDWSGCSVTNQATIDLPSHAVVGQPLTLNTTDSTLNYPRTDVKWDLSGTGSYTVDAGTAVTETYTPSQAGEQTVGVRITTEDGSVTVGSGSFMVYPSSSPTVTTATPTVTTTTPTITVPITTTPTTNVSEGVTSALSGSSTVTAGATSIAAGANGVSTDDSSTLSAPLSFSAPVTTALIPPSTTTTRPTAAKSKTTATVQKTATVPKPNTARKTASSQRSVQRGNVPRKAGQAHRTSGHIKPSRAARRAQLRG